MGGALLRRWMDADIVKQGVILDPNDSLNDSLGGLSHDPRLFHVKQAEDLDSKEYDLVIFAVKPQILDQVCRSLGSKITSPPPLLSIAAGKDITFFQNHFKDNPIIRSMPNIPALVGEGITALFASDNVSTEDKDTAAKLMNCVGQTVWLESEADMDAVTAVSGSGPAYLFHMIEALEAAAIENGLTPNIAKQLARQTIIGAAALAADQNDKNAKKLREAVTSKAGTTEAGLNRLMDGEFQKIMNETIATAKARSKELSS